MWVVWPVVHLHTYYNSVLRVVNNLSVASLCFVRLCSWVQMEFVDTVSGEVYMDGYPQEIIDMGEEAFMAAMQANQ